MSWLETLALAILQGLTEFLPVSSDGHLSVAQTLIRRYESAAPTPGGDLFYAVILHVGTLLAILAYYRKIGFQGVRGLLGDIDVPPEFRRESLVRIGVLVFITLLPLIPIGLGKHHIEALFGSLRASAIGFLITAAELLLVARLPEGRKTARETTWLDALLIGIAQAFAVLPGVSRSGSTIAVALALGFSRAWAVGFSLLIAVPAICGAAVLELRDVDPSSLSADLITKVATGTIVSGLIGYLAIVWLVKIVQRGRLWYFSVYLVILATLLLTFGSRVVGGRASETQPHGESVVPGGPA